MKSVFARQLVQHNISYIAAPGTPEAMLTVVCLGLNLVRRFNVSCRRCLSLLRDQIEEFRIVGVVVRAR